MKLFRISRPSLQFPPRLRRIGAVGSAATLVLVGVHAAPAAASSVGAASAWGANVYGELGDGTTANRAQPVLVTALPSGGVTAIAAGARHSLAVRCDGAVVAWGKNTSGELGNGTTTNSSQPVQVTGLAKGSGVVAVDGNAPPLSSTNTTGNGHSMALKSDGTVLGWGNDRSAEVGNGVASTSPVKKPVTVVSLGPGSGVVAIAAGGSFSMALKSDGTVLAWGHNTSGELGNGSTTQAPTPVQASGLGAGSGVVAIAAGTAFAMALKSDGTVLTWGNNLSGELGNGTIANSSTPVQVSGLGAGSGVVAISAGDAFAMALKSDGTVLAWGNNASGELGNGKAPTDSLIPVRVTGLGSGSGVVAIATGFSHALARTSSGSLYAWGGNNSGQLGDGTTNQINTPELLSAFTNAAAVSAGGSHTLALHPLSFTTNVNVGGAAILEGDSSTRKLTFPVTLSQPSTTTVTVNYAITAAGTGTGLAVPGVDFNAASGTLTFTPSSTTGLTPVQLPITATIYSDTAVEPDQTFSVVLSSPCSCVLGRSAATGTILNDDSNPSATVGVGGGSIVVGGGTGRKISFPVTLSKPLPTNVSVSYTLTPSTAIFDATCSSGGDFGGKLKGTVKFAVSSATGVTPVLKAISVPICPDPGPDSDETFTVTLSNLVGPASLIEPSAAGLIMAD